MSRRVASLPTDAASSAGRAIHKLRSPMYWRQHVASQRHLAAAILPYTPRGRRIRPTAPGEEAMQHKGPNNGTDGTMEARHPTRGA